jgi:hypothetical protein
MVGIPKTKRSGGPKTTEGKLVASQNALKTGTYSSLAVLPNESQEEFNQLILQFNHDFHPKDMIETSLVREMALITWKKLRLEKLEQSYFIKKLNAPIKQEDFIDCGLTFTDARYKFWVEDVKLSDEVAGIYRNLLKVIRPYVRKPIPVMQLSEIKNGFTFVYDILLDAYLQAKPLANKDPVITTLANFTGKFNGQPERYLTSCVFDALVPQYEAALWVTKNHDKINTAIEQIKQERLLMLMQSEGVRRANDDLGRSLIRVINEFRKHHQWRMQYGLIDACEASEE